ncbi:MAG: cobalt-zinc-cadmium efflux system outer membrane protein [Planctomycetota bacterium]|jgi:cobalt-zinc-cadmium efflux system outer membrane protein
MNSLYSAPILCLALAGCTSGPHHYRSSLSSWEQLCSDRAALAAPDIEDFDESAGLAELLSYARANSPAMGAAFQHWKGALELVPQVMALPNPRLTLGAYLSEVETRVGPMQGRVGLAQPFPWFGKLELAGDVAFEESEAAREMLEVVRLELDERVRNTWYEYAWVEKAIRINEGNRDLLAHWERVARTRMETGLGRHADVIRAQIELGKLEDRVQTLMDLRRPLAASLNASLNRSAAASLPQPRFSQDEIQVIDGKWLSESLTSSSPLLRAQDHRIRSAEHGIDLADKAFYPNFLVGADYTLIGSAENPAVSGSGDDALALTLGFDLPIWRSSYEAGSRQAEAKMRGSTLERDELLNKLSAQLEMALYKFRDASRRVELFGGSLVPKGEQSIQALNTGYQSGNEGFLDLIDAQRVLLEFQLQEARAMADRAKALATTERITGIQLNQER